MTKNYKKFLENKIVIAESFGTQISESVISELLLPHQRDIVKWAVEGGRRAIFASFGLGKTMMQLELASVIISITKRPFLIAMPLAVVGEFKRDNEFLQTGLDVEYITDSDTITDYTCKIYVTNYERIRKGDIDPEKFGGVSFDEASVLRNLKTETANYVLKYFGKINYRYVATATPTPNDFIEILNYADFLGVIDRGHALTRFFQRDSTHAGKLTLYENKKEEFWKWVATWAVFINKPSDLGYDDTGYLLPKMHLHEIEVVNYTDDVIQNKRGDIVLFKDVTKSLVDVSREKSDSVELRVKIAKDIVGENPTDNWILWHHREAERTEIEKQFKGYDLNSVYGSQPHQVKEDLIIDFSEGRYQIISSKPQIAGSGCNLQHHCHNMIFVGIDYKFNDFIQAIHRVYRFKQSKEVHVYILFTQNEREVLKALKTKWAKHIELQTEMINLVREYGLNSDKIKADMKRQIFSKPRSSQIGAATVFNNDTVIQHQPENMTDNSTDMILTSIPFGDHYEYSDNYNDMGHNNGNEEFFKQMDFLTPNLLRTLKPGRIAAIHVKDRIRYSYQNGTSFTTIDDFSGKTVAHFTKEAVKLQIEDCNIELESLKKAHFFIELNKYKFVEAIILERKIEKLQREIKILESDYVNRFHLIGKITITTDVVRENNSTYRLGWSEQCKDASKMGVGLPEYVLLFRKPPSEMNNAYADTPVTKSKIDYDIARWQLDAHAYWKSDGNRFLSSEEIQKSDFKRIVNHWKRYNLENIYNFSEHLQVCHDLEKQDKLSRLFMTLPTHSNQELVWTDINRMHTLNTNQANRKKEKHICPLQLDIIERLINRFTMPGEIVDDPFGGLFSTAYKSLEMGRGAISCELNPEYYNDGLFYLKSIEYKINVPTLFDLLSEGVA